MVDMEDNRRPPVNESGSQPVSGVPSHAGAQMPQRPVSSAQPVSSPASSGVGPSQQVQQGSVQKPLSPMQQQGQSSHSAPVQTSHPSVPSQSPSSTMPVDVPQRQTQAPQQATSPQSEVHAQRSSDIVRSSESAAQGDVQQKQSSEPSVKQGDERRPSGPTHHKRQRRLRPGMADILAGESKDFNENLQPYLPGDLIGGSIPHVPGTEDEAVWNAAAQACGTERVHYVYTVDAGRIWYLACPSSAVASNPDSWCPLAAALPGNSEHWDKETVYLYEQEGMASALRWDPETGRMQVYLGATRTILPRMQSMDANFVTINAESADIVKWQNRTLNTEKMSRAVVRMLIMTGMGVNAIAAAILLFSIISIAFIHNDLNSIKQETDQAAFKLMESAAEVMQSDTIRHMVRIQHLLDSLSQSNGYLVRYEVIGKKTEWDAIVPTGLSTQAQLDTTNIDIVGSSVKKMVPKVQKEDDDNVRLVGTK